MRLSGGQLQYKAWQLQNQQPYRTMTLQVASDDNSVCTFDPPESKFQFDLKNSDILDTAFSETIKVNFNFNLIDPMLRPILYC